MMIAEKLLACATPAPIGNTLFLGNWAAIGAPTAQIGALESLDAGVSVPHSVRLQNSGGYVKAVFSIPPSDWIFELFFDGGAMPAISSSPPYFAGTDLGWLYLSDNGVSWTHAGVIPPHAAGQNHLAFGRQAGVMQAWLNGQRFISGPAGQYPYQGSGSITMYGYGISIGPARAVRADVYGDSATITVPAIPLGII